MHDIDSRHISLPPRSLANFIIDSPLGFKRPLAALFAGAMDPVFYLLQGGELDLTWGRHVIWELYRYPILGLPRFGMLRGVPVELDIALDCIRLRSQQPAASSLELKPAAHVGQRPSEQAKGEGAAVPPEEPPQQNHEIISHDTFTTNNTTFGSS